MTNLERRWALFFQLAGWSWTYQPRYKHFLRPTFHVCFQCAHSECDGSHELDVFVLDVNDTKDFGVTVHDLAGVRPSNREMCEAYEPPHPALFGASPSISKWEMCHGSDGGEYDVRYWVDDWKELWNIAGLLTRASSDKVSRILSSEARCQQ